MDDLYVDDLQISVQRREAQVEISWEGISETRDPGSSLSPYLEQLASEIHGTEVMVDFSAMEYMNSATVAPIVRFIRALDKECSRVTVLYDESKTFQRTTFSAIKALGVVLPHLEVRTRDNPAG